MAPRSACSQRHAWRQDRGPLKCATAISSGAAHRSGSGAAINVACVGDSITQGYLASRGMDYPTQMQKLTMNTTG